VTPAAKARPQQLFYDDFSGNALDRTKWNVVVQTRTNQIVNNEQQIYVDSPSTVYLSKDKNAEAKGASGGVLVLKANYSPGTAITGGTRDFTSGRINTSGKFDLTHGSVSARLKVPAGEGMWPAFWLLGYGAWPRSGEIDIMEYVGESDWISAATHGLDSCGRSYAGDAAPVNKAYLFPSYDATEWHTYKVDWTKTSMTFFIDGHLFYRVTKPMIQFFGDWVFDNPEYVILNQAVGGVYPFKTSGIRSPYYGLSQQALNNIKNGEAKYIIDWVRVDANDDTIRGTMPNGSTTPQPTPPFTPAPCSTATPTPAAR